MAKSQLEIVLLDESGGMPPPSPTQAAAAASTASAPATPTQAAAAPASRTDRQAREQDQRPRQRDTSAIDVAGRVVDMTVRALGIGQFVGEFTRVALLLRDVARLGRSPAVERERVPVIAAKPVEPVTLPTSAPAAAIPTPAAPATVPATLPTTSPDTTTATAPTTSPATTTAAASVATPAATTARAATTGAAATGAPAAAAALNPVAVAALAVGAAFAGLVIGSKLLANVLSQTVEDIAGYSAEVSAATAESELRAERSTMRRAAQVGPQAAQFERSRSRMEERFSAMGTSLLELGFRLFAFLEPTLSKLLSASEAGVAGVGTAVEGITLMADVLTPWDDVDPANVDRYMKAQDKFTKEFLEIFRGEAEDVDPLESEFLRTFMGLGAEMRRRLDATPGRFTRPRRAERRAGP